MGAILTDILTILTGGFSTFASGIGSGINDFVTQMFLVESEGAMALSTFGGLVLVFAAISLTLGLSRWCLSFFTSLGQRNR